VKVLLVPRTKLMPIIFTLCVVGSFAIQSRSFDIGVMVVFGILGFYMREMNYPIAPMVLGIILGDILDKNLRRALILSDGNILPFFTRPISLVLFLITVFIIISRMPWFSSLMARARSAVRAKLRRP